jgi:hypothetical protein
MHEAWNAKPMVHTTGVSCHEVTLPAYSEGSYKKSELPMLENNSKML